MTLRNSRISGQVMHDKKCDAKSSYFNYSAITQQTTRRDQFFKMYIFVHLVRISKVCPCATFVYNQLNNLHKPPVVFCNFVKSVNHRLTNTPNQQYVVDVHSVCFHQEFKELRYYQRVDKVTAKIFIYTV